MIPQPEAVSTISLDEQKVTYLYGSGTKTVLASSLTPMRALRAKCLDCSDGSAKEVKLCCISECPLWVYRFGKRPGSVVDATLLDPEHVQTLADEQSRRELGGNQPEGDAANPVEKPGNALLGGPSAPEGANPDSLGVPA